MRHIYQNDIIKDIQQRHIRHDFHRKEQMTMNFNIYLKRQIQKQ